LSAFGAAYAKYYDLFYSEKDYAAESEFVCTLIRRYAPAAKSILELGCGSAGHAIRLAARGFSVDGVDMSPAMIALGRDNIAQLPCEQRKKLTLFEGDVTTFLPQRRYHAVISLFHVASYQTINDALNGFFRTARAALDQDGIFVFDFWHGPAVLTNRPQARVRRIEADDSRVTRIAEPKHHAARNVVDVHYDLLIQDKATGSLQEIQEVHSMRYLFLPEVEMLASINGFEILESGEWMTGRHLDEHCWSAYTVARST
jgi:SAM-dependent methyltransferase